MYVYVSSDIRSVIESILLKFYWNQDDVDEFLHNVTFDYDHHEHQKLPFFKISLELPPLTDRVFKNKTFEK